MSARKLGVLGLCLALLPVAASAGDECRFYTYKAQITQVYDGDTVTADIDLGFHIWVRGEKLRLYGIDTPEMRSNAAHKVDAAEKFRAVAAKNALSNLILNKDVILCTLKDKKGKYGRYLAKITTLDGVDVNEWMIKQGHAKPYMREAAALN